MDHGALAGSTVTSHRSVLKNHSMTSFANLGRHMVFMGTPANKKDCRIFYSDCVNKEGSRLEEGSHDQAVQVQARFARIRILVAGPRF